MPPGKGQCEGRCLRVRRPSLYVYEMAKPRARRRGSTHGGAETRRLCARQLGSWAVGSWRFGGWQLARKHDDEARGARQRRLSNPG